MKPPIHGRAKCTTPILTRGGTFCLVCGRKVQDHAGYEYYDNPGHLLRQISTPELLREIVRRAFARFRK